MLSRQQVYMDDWQKIPHDLYWMIYATLNTVNTFNLDGVDFPKH